MLAARARLLSSHSLVHVVAASRGPGAPPLAELRHMAPRKHGRARGGAWAHPHRADGQDRDIPDDVVSQPGCVAHPVLGQPRAAAELLCQPRGAAELTAKLTAGFTVGSSSGGMGSSLEWNAAARHSGS